MKNLKSLIRIISAQRIKTLDIVSENHTHKGKLQALYNGIKNGTINNDATLEAIIYGQPTNKKTISQLKRRLEKKLYNSLFFIDQNQKNFTDYRKALHSVSKNVGLIIILIDRVERSTAIDLAERILKISLDYEFTQFSIIIIRILLRHYAFLEPNDKKYKKYSLLLEHCNKVNIAEMTSEKYYCEISNIYAKKREAFDATKIERLKSYWNVLRKKQGQVTSFKFNLDTYQLGIFYYLKIRNFTEALSLAYEALAFFDRKPFSDKLSKFIIKNDIIHSSMQLKKFDTANTYIEENLDILTPGSFNWFKMLNVKFINYSLQGKYQFLPSLISSIFSSPHLRSFSIHYESWLIKEAYVQFLIRMDKIDPEYIEKYPLRKFRLARFLNEVPLYSKDKRGLNISILIIQMLFLIEQKKFDKVIDRMDALKQYTYRYLRNDETLRSNCFIKMLLKIPEAGFHPLRGQRHAEKLHKKLVATPMEISEQSSEIEIIPYEKLWEMVIELLGKIRK